MVCKAIDVISHKKIIATNGTVCAINGQSDPPGKRGVMDLLFYRTPVGSSQRNTPAVFQKQLIPLQVDIPGQSGPLIPG